jgi:hypothetical protein
MRAFPSLLTSAAALLLLSVAPVWARTPVPTRPELPDAAAAAFRNSMAELSVRLDLGETGPARAMARQAAGDLQKLREAAIPATVRRAAIELKMTITMDSGAMVKWRILRDRIADVGTPAQAAADDLTAAAAAIQARRPVEMRAAVTAALDEIAAGAVGFPVKAWACALRRADEALSAGNTGDLASAARLMRTLPGMEPLRDELAAEGFRRAEQGVAEAMQNFRRGANSTGTAALEAVRRPMEVAAAACGDARLALRVKHLANKLDNAERLIVRTPYYDGWGWGGNAWGGGGWAWHRGLGMLESVRYELDRLALEAAAPEPGARPYDSGSGVQ